MGNIDQPTGPMDPNHANAGGQGSFGNTGGLYVVPGKGYGNVPDSVISNPSASPYMGMASDAAYKSFQASGAGSYGSQADMLRQQGYQIAGQQAQTGYDNSQRLWNTLYGHLNDFHSNLSNSLGSWLSGNAGGFKPPDLNSLLQPIMAQQATREQLATNQAKNTFTAQGRDPSSSAYLGQIMPALQSRFSTDNAAELSKATLSYLDPLLRNQQANAQLGFNMFNTQNQQYMDLARTLSGMKGGV